MEQENSNLKKRSNSIFDVIAGLNKSYKVKIGDRLVTLYATTDSRLDLGKKVFDDINMFDIE